MGRLFTTQDERARALVVLTAALMSSRASAGKIPTPCRNALQAIQQLERLEDAYQDRCCREEAG